MAQTIAIIDYGMGNLHSAQKALEYVAPNDRVIVTGDAQIIADADRVVLPGVGAIRDCMSEIRRQGVDREVQAVLSQNKPMLGICVGMQALLQKSEENGGVDCMGLLQGELKFFGKAHQDTQGNWLKVPHMGWNQLDIKQEHPIFEDIASGERFYFVHSYYAATDCEGMIASCNYGHDFAAVVAKGNLIATQFHPEKSHTAGLQLLKNFVNWQGESA